MIATFVDLDAARDVRSLSRGASKLANKLLKHREQITEDDLLVTLDNLSIGKQEMTKFITSKLLEAYVYNTRHLWKPDDESSLEAILELTITRTIYVPYADPEPEPVDQRMIASITNRLLGPRWISLIKGTGETYQKLLEDRRYRETILTRKKITLFLSGSNLDNDVERDIVKRIWNI